MGRGQKNAQHCLEELSALSGGIQVHKRLGQNKEVLLRLPVKVGAECGCDKGPFQVFSWLSHTDSFIQEPGEWAVTTPQFSKY